MSPSFAFTASLPLTPRPHLHQFRPNVTARRAGRSLMTVSPLPGEQTNKQDESKVQKGLRIGGLQVGVWNGVCKLVRLTALSATLLLAPAATRASSSASRRVTPPVAMASASTSSSTSSSSSTSDVEAAAMTLGAVTLGGLCMRVILSRSRDEAAEKAKLEAECNRLAEEERQRALRAERKRLESVDGDEQDEQLWSAFRKRLESLDSEESDQTTKNTKKDDMRHNPIPDRGMGSAVLDRPDNNKSDSNSNSDPTDSNGDEEGEREGNIKSEGENLAKPDEAEMLKRMWNLSPPDKE